jgi:hypothetical protein
MLASAPKGWSIERIREYFDWSKKVIDQVSGTNPKLERRFDQLGKGRSVADARRSRRFDSNGVLRKSWRHGISAPAN